MKKVLYYIILMAILISVKNAYAIPPIVVEPEPGNGVGSCATVNPNGTITYGNTDYENETAFFNALTNGIGYPFEASYANNSFVPQEEPEPTTTREYNEADGSYTIKDSEGNVIGFEGKRIYTVGEANLVSGKVNTVKLRYK